MRAALSLLTFLALATPAWPEVRTIPGPLGPLAAEALAVPGAAHVLVLVPGSGPTDRNGDQPGTAVMPGTLRLLAEGLAAEGIASLRIDKRGMFQSARAIADANAVTIADYAQDLRHWVAEARSLAPCVWIAGHSEGGLVALATAAADPPEGLCGLILLAAPGRPLGEVLVAQMRATPMNAPLADEVERLVSDLVAGRGIDATTLPAPLRPLFRPEVLGYLADLFAQDPARLAAAWPGPTLIVSGSADLQVLPADAERLGAALPQAERLVLAGGTHALKVDVPGAPFATYLDPALPLHPDLVPAIAAFVGRHPPG